MNSTNITTFQPIINKLNDIPFVIFIAGICIAVFCCVSCYVFIIITRFIKLLLLYLCYYNNRNQENKDSKIKYIYDIFFGSLSLPVLTDIVVIHIPNNTS